MSRSAAKACPATRLLLDDVEHHQGDANRWARMQTFEYDSPERERREKLPPEKSDVPPGANPWGDNSPWCRMYRYGVHRNFRPFEYFERWIRPLMDFAVRGAVWHQGESEGWASDAVAGSYGEALRALIADWRCQWGQPDMPFGIVQIHNYKNSEKSRTNWKAV